MHISVGTYEYASKSPYHIDISRMWPRINSRYKYRIIIQIPAQHPSQQVRFSQNRTRAYHRHGHCVALILKMWLTSMTKPSE